MLTLERELADDNSGHHKNGVKRSLYAEFNRVQTMLNAGTSPDEYSKLSLYSESVKLAYDVVELVWTNRHRQN